MRNEQDYNDRNFRNRAWHHDRYNRHPDHEQNSANRWGEPNPYMGPHGEEQRRHEERHGNSRDFNRDDWRPFEQRDNRRFQEEDRYRNNYRNEHPDWQRYNQPHHAPENQHARNRWSSGNEMPHHQHHHPRHASERFYREQRRRDY